MKKILFIMPLMAISLLASCGNNNPQKDEYTVNEQEMKDAFAMKDVEYLQVNGTREGVDSGIMEFTPTSNHDITTWGSEYAETLILKDGDNYSKYVRNSKEEPFTPDTYEEGDFLTIAEYTDVLFGPFKDKEYTDFYYNEEKKEYMCYLATTIKIYVALSQFSNKKIVKFTALSTASKLRKDTYTFTYDKIEPPSPTI